jgi:hypothetical protein
MLRTLKLHPENPELCFLLIPQFCELRHVKLKISNYDNFAYSPTKYHMIVTCLAKSAPVLKSLDFSETFHLEDSYFNYKEVFEPMKSLQVINLAKTNVRGDIFEEALRPVLSHSLIELNLSNCSQLHTLLGLEKGAGVLKSLNLNQACAAITRDTMANFTYLTQFLGKEENPAEALKQRETDFFEPISLLDRLEKLDLSECNIATFDRCKRFFTGCKMAKTLTFFRCFSFEEDDLENVFEFLAVNFPALETLQMDLPGKVFHGQMNSSQIETQGKILTELFKKHFAASKLKTFYTGQFGPAAIQLHRLLKTECSFLITVDT